MIIKLGRAGGFAGIGRPPRVLDTTRINPARAKDLLRHVEESRFFELPPEILPAQPKPDSFQYALTIEDGNRSHTVTTTQDAAPGSLQALLHATREELQQPSDPGSA